MVITRREVIEGQQNQGVDESIAYALTTTPWGSSPSNVVVEVFDASNGMANVSTTTLTGTPTVAGDVITLPLLSDLVEGHLYRVEVKFDCSGNTFEAFIKVMGEK